MQPPEDDRNKGINGNLNVQGSTLTSSRDMNLHITQNQVPPKDAMEILENHVAFGALFNSDERFDPPKCHKDTRKAVLGSIDRWAQGLDDSSKPIMWLRGAMGAGKSAIAQTSAERWAKLKVLAASFFFSRTVAGRNESSHLIPTLAYQLTLSIPSTRPHIEHAILKDMGLFRKGLSHQMEALIIQPLTAAGSEGGLGQQVVVIDGLDECCQKITGKDHEAQQREILEAITSYASQSKCPIRFLIASRPEHQIRTSFMHTRLTILSRTIALDDTQNPNADIELFLNCSFDELRHKHPYLDSSWPPDGTISTLIHKSSGHFIYASTAARYLKRPRQDPRIALDAILNINTKTNARDSPFAELDALYILIMHSVVPESLPIVHSIFELMCFRGNGLSSLIRVFADCDYMSPISLERYLFLPPGSLTYTHLVDLHSILEVPPENPSKEAPIRFIHASFSEFLTNQSRSGSFCVKKDAAHSRFLLIRLKHVFIQSLQPDLGAELGYLSSGFTLGLSIALDGDKRSPPQGFVEGLTALIGEDKEVFAGYVRSADLAHFGVERNCEGLKQSLMRMHASGGENGIEIILGYLKKHGIRNFKTFIEGYELREEELVCPETRPPLPPFPSPSLNQQYFNLPFRLDAPTSWDGHPDEPSATTQVDTYDVSAAPPKSLRGNSKKRGREVDSPPTPVTASSSQRTTRSMAKSVANDGCHPQMANPVSVVKARAGGKKELKQAVDNSNQKRRR